MTSAAGDDDEARSTQRADELVGWLGARLPAACTRCATRLCAHELLFANALGHKLAPVCGACAAREIGAVEPDALRRHLRAHFERRSCYRTAWHWADVREPDCPAGRVRPEDSMHADAEPVRAHPDRVSPDRVTIEVPDDFWDAGDLGCGELVLELRVRMRSLGAGETLELFARDPGAPEDLPAWCRMTGHELVDARAPRYVIRRRRD